MSTELPPGSDRERALTETLEAAYAALGPDYRPRTHLLGPDGRARFVNRLIRETSPYLRQHAHNPVDWRPWGAETLAEAATLDRPIFLSVGYATCHWCHVMEEESFDDVAVAAVLNAGFVPVKLDREERPDLDHIYITATQLQQGHAGWPNSVWLTPSGQPFHTGTYFPKERFLEVLDAVAAAWAKDRAKIEDVAERIGAAVAGASAPAGREDEAETPLGPGVYSALSAQLAQFYNAAEGGFGEAQQFPQEGFLLWLLDHWRRTGDASALGVASHSLQAIAAGGIHDHAGGGFHRYTVDANWRTPHFEKMLYNQGLLARVFVEGWEAVGEPAWARAALRCFDYVRRDMTAPEGYFYAAEDADSLDAEGRREEGAFYAFTPAEAEEALSDLAPEERAWATETLGLKEAPTIEAGAVLHLAPGREAAFDRLEPALERLRRAREARARPVRDDKVIAGWNGLMIRALAEGAEAFGRPDLAEDAARAGEALWSALWDELRDGRQLSRLVGLDGGPDGGQGAGLLEDYAWLGLGYLALSDATGQAVWLERAEALADAAAEAFSDPSGRLRMAQADGPLGPIYESQDGATPAGESSMVELWARLALRREAPRYAMRARGVVAAVSATLAQMPVARPDLLSAARVLAGGESEARRCLAYGRLRARLALFGDEGPRLHLALTEGWHIAAGGAGTLAPVLEGAEALWPVAARRSAGFADGAEMEVHEGRFTVEIEPKARDVTLRVQVCSENLCLAPE
ncbi:MAG: thioredoxin domain-containing protein, partial [Pseudomonadota bacterium]